MNKEKLIKRLAVSGALLVQVASIAAPVVQVSALTSSAEYTQEQFATDMSAYKQALKKYEADQAQYEKDKAKYDKDSEEFKKAEAKYQADLAQYEKDKVQYEKDKAVYDQKKIEFDRALADAEANKNTVGYLSQPEAQDLIFEREHDAKVTISGTGHFLSSESGLNDILDVINTSGGTHIRNGNEVRAAQWKDVDNPGKVGGAVSDYRRINATAMAIMPGESITVRYDDLKKTTISGKKIASVEYKYSVMSSPANDVSATMVIYQDPTVTTYFGTDKDNPLTDLKIRTDVTFFYADGSKVDLGKDGNSLVSFASLNYSSLGDGSPQNVVGEQEYAQPIAGLTPIQINGSSVVYSGGKIAATSSNNWKAAGSQMDRAEWDSTAENPNSYYGAGAAKASGTTISFVMGNHSLSINSRSDVRQWFQFNSMVRSAGVPNKPVPPTPPTPPTPPADAPNPPVPPKKPEIPVGPTSIKKSVSADDKTYSSASNAAEAVDVGKQDKDWYWKLDVTLSNNTDYKGLSITDTLEDVQVVKESDIHVYDHTGKDVTSQGKVTTAAAGAGKTAYTWTANADYVSKLNAAFGTKANATEQPTMSMKIKATAKGTDVARLRQYFDQTVGNVVIPNTASITAEGTCGNTGAVKTITERSNNSHVKFHMENEVSNPEKRVSDLNERNVDRNNLGLVDRNQKYTISFDTGAGTIFNKLNINDDMPKGFTSNGKAVITNAAGKDITSLFNVSINGQNFKASIKDEAKTSPDLVNTKVTIALEGTAVRWLGDTIKNTATIEDFSKTIKTNETVTVIPDDGKAVKESAASEEAAREGEFDTAETDETATKVSNVRDTYVWRNTFTLPDHTEYTKIVLTDTFENIQSVDTSKMQILDSEGNNVATQGKFEVKDLNDKQKTITWTANDEFIKATNAKFGPNSDAKPTITFVIPTTVGATELAKLEPYKNANKEIIIPNTATISLRDNSGITSDYRIDTNTSKVNVPSRVDPGEDGSEPSKSVSDNNETDVSENTLGFENVAQTYTIKAATAAGWKLDKLNFRDDMPDEFQTSLEQVKITNGDGKDVKGLFDIAIGEGNVLTANLREDAKQNKDVIDTMVTLTIDGTFAKGLGKTVTNQATVEDPNESYETGVVKTHIPSTPESKKTVSVDKGQTFVESGDLAKRSDEYTWKVDHVLANHTEYEAITLTDELEGIQAISPEKVKVFGYDGQDITTKGKVTVKDANGKKLVTWEAGAEAIKDINSKFGKASDAKPTMSMEITTDVKDAKNADEAKYFNAETGRVEIPNTGAQKLRAKNEGGIEVRSNTPKVNLPKPGESSAKKFVAKDGDKPQWSDKLELDNFDAVYQYRTEFKLAENFNLDEGALVLTDIYENLQSYDKIVLEDASGADITEQFNIKAEKNPNSIAQTLITATPKRANDFDDAGATINMIIKGAKLTGATPQQQVAYLSTKDSEGGFHKGVTIPNLSKIQMLSAIPDGSQIRESNKTYVNFNLEANLSKKIEAEQTEAVDPAKATSATSLTDLIISAQDLLTNPGKAKKGALEKLSKALTDESTTQESLLNLLIEAAK